MIQGVPPASILTMTITQFLHTAILVTDLDKAEHFYGTVLGLTKVDRQLKFPGAWYQIGAHQIHLIVAPQVTPDHVEPTKWGRNPHLALGVTDLDQIKTHLQAADRPIQMSSSGRAALFTQDPDGNIVELSQVEG